MKPLAVVCCLLSIGSARIFWKDPKKKNHEVEVVAEGALSEHAILRQVETKGKVNSPKWKDIHFSAVSPMEVKCLKAGNTFASLLIEQIQEIYSVIDPPGPEVRASLMKLDILADVRKKLETTVQTPAKLKELGKVVGSVLIITHPSFIWKTDLVRKLLGNPKFEDESLSTSVAEALEKKDLEALYELLSKEEKVLLSNENLAQFTWDYYYLSESEVASELEPEPQPESESEPELESASLLNIPSLKEPSQPTNEASEKPPIEELNQIYTEAIFDLLGAVNSNIPLIRENCNELIAHETMPAQERLKKLMKYYKLLVNEAAEKGGLSDIHSRVLNLEKTVCSLGELLLGVLGKMENLSN